MSEESVRVSKATSYASDSIEHISTSIRQLAVAIRSPDKNVYIPALKTLLDIIINDPESIERIYENDIISILNKYIIEEEGEAYVFSSSILHIIGIRSGSVDYSIRAQTATEPMIQIIHSPNEKKSKAGSKTLCDLIEENEQIRNSLLTTGFVQIVLHSLTSNTQIPSQQSSSSSNNQIPTFVKIGLLNVIQKLTDEEEGLQSLSVLIPILEELKQNGEDQLKNKAKRILGLLQAVGIKYSTNQNDQEKDQKIKELENFNKQKDEQLRITAEELHRVEKEKEKEIIEKERLKLEIIKLKEDIVIIQYYWRNIGTWSRHIAGYSQ
ncbi:MAG: hypothetical protein EZS28_008909 [Streblomastix strix]|uniref:Uncharacterized protein n=1 Tax=Streblomastix strix TaxID=222440 RepID=A0A5J4WMW2_9EUKA|nr:MAG: hypothetical protein EZS28_008909 [Streblomastix strix]